MRDREEQGRDGGQPTQRQHGEASGEGARGSLLARELDDDWVEAEPGIFYRASSRPPAPTASEDPAPSLEDALRPSSPADSHEDESPKRTAHRRGWLRRR